VQHLFKSSDLFANCLVKMDEGNNVFSISIFHKFEDERLPILVCSVESLDDISIWKRGSIREVVRFAGREVVKRTALNQRLSTEHLSYRCHTFVNENSLGVAILTTLGYPPRVAHDLIKIVFDQFVEIDFYKTNKDKLQNQTKDVDFHGYDSVLTDLINQYKTPEQIDRIMLIENELEETKQIILNSLDRLLARGERLEDLVNRTNDLSFSTKQFAKRSDDLNKCCTWL